MVDNTLIRADTHAHYYDCFDEQAFLSAAFKNLCMPSEIREEAYGVLFLAEAGICHWFEQLSIPGADHRLARMDFKLVQTAEPISMIIEDSSGHQLTVIRGRQIVCEERLEILALGYMGDYPDGSSISQVLPDICESGALAVLPWGVGKWLGTRGRIVENLLESPPCMFHLGDIGGRLAMMPEPSLFGRAVEKGIKVLPGTDVLPFSREAKKIGTVGLEWKDSFDTVQPGQRLIRALGGDQVHSRRFGQLEKISAFVRNQLSMQIRKHVG